MSTPEIEGSYRTPRFEHARVSDAMRQGVFTCAAGSSLRQAARTMSLHHVHTVVVTDPADGSPVGILSDAQLVGALLENAEDERTLADVADRDLGTISSGATLRAAADIMRERGVAHLLVCDERSGIPTGMISTLDIAGIFAWGEA